MIAFHFPPMSGSSGYLRPLRFAEYLRDDFDWYPIILTAHPAIYPRINSEGIEDIERHLEIHRARALDTQQHLSFRGKFLQILALPDRWISWYVPALIKGVKLIRRHRPEIIWSTSPIATTHLVAASLAKLFRIPWIADFRDPMTLEDYPRNPYVERRLVGWRKLPSTQHVFCVLPRPTRDLSI